MRNYEGAYFIILLLNIVTIIAQFQNDSEDYSGGGAKISYLYPVAYGLPNKNSSLKLRNWENGYSENPEFLGTYTEGDILFPLSRRRNGVIKEAMRWPLGIVPYRISKHYSSSQRYTIERAMKAFEKDTCIRFIRKKSEHHDYIYIDNEDAGCYSSVGRLGGRQEINLETPVCLKSGTIIHELMHAIGIAHEHARPDRDDFVIILYENVEPSMKHNFVKASDEKFTDFGYKYDYKSLMHYSNYAFSYKSAKTMMSKFGNVRLGLANHFTKLDIAKIKYMYHCTAVSIFYNKWSLCSSIIFLYILM